MANRFASFKPTVEAQTPIQQPVKKTEVRANADKFKPQKDRAKDLQNQKVKQMAADEFDDEYQKVEPKVKQGGANARRTQEGGPKRYGTSDRKPDERGRATGRGRFQGKPREDAHPMDRQSGTGRGRDIKKGGQGKGNWGGDRREVFENQDSKVVEAVQEEETKDIVENPDQADEKTKDKSEKTPEVQQEEEEEEKDQGMTLDEFLASKKKANVKAQARENEKINDKNLMANDNEKKHQETITADLTDAQVYNPIKSDHVELFGFKGDDDALVRTKTKGGRKHKSHKKDSNVMKVDEESFPSF